MCCIIAMVSSRLKSSSCVDTEVSRSRLRRASAMRPFRMSHQGDSGARNATMISGTGQTHWGLAVSPGATHLDRVRDSPAPIIGPVEQTEEHGR